MTKKSGFSPSFYGMLLIFVCLTAMAVLPSALKKTSYRWDAAWSDKSAGSMPAQFPLDHVLPVIQFPGKKETGKISLKDLAKASPKGIIVNFWATWCPPCVEELPSLETLGRQLSQVPGHELPQIVTISVDDNPTVVKDFLKTLDYPVALPVLYDKDAELSRSVGTTRFPETYWISSEGKVLYKWVGPQDWLGGDVLKRIQAMSR